MTTSTAPSGPAIRAYKVLPCNHSYKQTRSIFTAIKPKNISSPAKA